MGLQIPNFYSIINLSDTSRQLGEFGLITLGMMIVLVGGGIDLSVSSVYALSNVITLALFSIAGSPLTEVIPTVLVLTIKKSIVFNEYITSKGFNSFLPCTMLDFSRREQL